MRNGGLILWIAIAICEMSKTSWRMGKLKGPIIPLGAMVEYHPISIRDQSRLHQFGNKVLPGIFRGYALVAGEIWKGDILIAVYLKITKTTLQAKDTTQRITTFSTQVYSYAASHENSGCEGSTGQGMEEARNNFSVAAR